MSISHKLRTIHGCSLLDKIYSKVKTRCMSFTCPHTWIQEVIKVTWITAFAAYGNKNFKTFCFLL